MSIAINATEILIEQNTDGSDQTATTSAASVTLAAGKSYILVWETMAGTGAQADCTAAGPGSLTWTHIRRANGPGTSEAMQALAVIGDGSNGQITVTRGGSHNWKRWSFLVYEVTGGVQTIGAVGAGMFITANSASQAQTTSTSFTKNYAQAFAAGSAGFAVWCRTGGSVASTVNGGVSPAWTEVYDAAHSTYYRLAVHTVHDASTTQAGADYGADTGTKWGMIFELAAAASGNAGTQRGAMAGGMHELRGGIYAHHRSFIAVPELPKGWRRRASGLCVRG